MLLWFLSGFCYWFFRSLSVRCEAIVISQGSVLLSGPLSPSRPDPCLFFNCLSSSFLSLSGVFVDAVSLSLSLSFFLSQALGKPKPRVGFGFPLVFSASRPRTSSSTRTPWSSTSPRLRPAPVFFRRSIAVSVFFSCLVLSVLVVMVGVCCGR